MRLRVVVAGCSEESGQKLKCMLQERGATLTTSTDGAEGVVSYGVSGVRTTKPMINRNVLKFGKYNSFNRFSLAGLNVPAVFPGDWTANGKIPARYFPVIGRSDFHYGGTDMKKYDNPQQLARATRSHDFFVQFIPSVTEYRLWVYHQRVLGIYQKVVLEPEKIHLSCGRNCDFGWGFSTRQRCSPEMVDCAIRATAALQLDFGAIDILITGDRRYFPLEVNTAPGIETMQHGGMNRLADEIIAWGRNGFHESTWR